MYNKVTLVGRLGQTPEERSLPNGDIVCALSVATSEKWRDKQGDMQEKTEWWRVVCFKQPAEFATRYLKKGDLVLVEGTGSTRAWEDKNGNERKQFEVRAILLKALRSAPASESEPEGRPKKDASPPQERSKPKIQETGYETVADMYDDIPF